MRDLKELSLWLEGREKAQVDWRLDPKNRAQVSEFVDQYAATVGGRDPSWMNSVLRQERRIADIRRVAAEKEQKDREKLLEVIRQDFISGGGLPEDFEAREKEIVASYALSGRSAGIVEKAERLKRSQAARTM